MSRVIAQAATPCQEDKRRGRYEWPETMYIDKPFFVSAIGVRRSPTCGLLGHIFAMWVTRIS
jgi:hypothetical protein